MYIPCRQVAESRCQGRPHGEVDVVDSHEQCVMDDAENTSAMVKLAEEIDESATEVVSYGMVRRRFSVTGRC